MPAKTKLDIHLAASDAARAALNITDPVAAYSNPEIAFESGGNASADFTLFLQVYNERLAQYKQLATQPAPNVTAAKAAAAAATAPAKT